MRTIRTISLAIAAAFIAVAPADAAYRAANGMIAFTHRVPGTDGSWSIQTVNPDGSGHATVQTDVGTPGWSPEGNRLFAVRASFSGTTGLGYSTLVVMNADGTGERTVSEGIPAVRSPSWSPDGTKIAYKDASPSNSASGQIWVMNADGSGRSQVTTDAFGKLELDWGATPSGSRIAYVSGESGPGWGMYTIAPDGSNRTRIAAVSTQLAFRAGRLDWSPDGTKIVFASAPIDPARYVCDQGSCNYDSDIYLVDLVAGTVRNLTNTVAWAGPYEIDPVFSPDGTSIAFAAYTYFRAGIAQRGPTRIYTMRLDGTDVRAVTNPRPVTVNGEVLQTADTLPDWQPCIAGVTNACVSVTPPAPPNQPPAPPTPPNPPPPAPPAPSNPAPRENGPPAGGTRGRGAATLVIQSFTATPHRPRAGRLFTVRIRVAMSDGRPVSSAGVTCRAAAGGKALKTRVSGMNGRTASCTWFVPRNVRGLLFTGSIAARTRGERVARAFTWRVR
jgi:dipeptidyl aminopeptidase/acylaminoacyl peptidase